MQLTEAQIAGPVVSESELIERIARRVVAMRLETPAVLWLEMNKPLAFIASQALVVGTPLLGLVLNPEDLIAFGNLLRDRRGVERLIDRIEELSLEKKVPPGSGTLEGCSMDDVA